MTASSWSRALRHARTTLRAWRSTRLGLGPLISGFFPAVLAANWLSFEPGLEQLGFVAFWSAWGAMSWMSFPNPAPPTVPLSRAESAVGIYLAAVVVQIVGIVLQIAFYVLPLYGLVAMIFGDTGFAPSLATMRQWAFATAAAVVAFPALGLGLALRPVPRGPSEPLHASAHRSGIRAGVIWFPFLLVFAWLELPPSVALLLHGCVGLVIGRAMPVRQASVWPPQRPSGDESWRVKLASPLTPSWPIHLVRLAVSSAWMGVAVGAFGGLLFVLEWLENPNHAWDNLSSIGADGPLLVSWLAMIAGLLVVRSGERFSPFLGPTGAMGTVSTWTLHLPLAPRQHLWHGLAASLLGLSVVGLGLALVSVSLPEVPRRVFAVVFGVCALATLVGLGAQARSTRQLRPPARVGHPWRRFAVNALGLLLVVTGVGTAILAAIGPWSGVGIGTGVAILLGSAAVDWVTLYRELGA